eukprot:scaffold29647_cov145-Isochrysis_galbana.AAC.11
MPRLYIYRLWADHGRMHAQAVSSNAVWIDVRSFDELELKEVRESAPIQLRTFPNVYDMLPLTSPTANGTWSTSPQEIGTGASSVVRRAVHNPSGQLVAVKQIQILEKKSTRVHLITLHALPAGETRPNGLRAEDYAQAQGAYACAAVILSFVSSLPIALQLAPSAMSLCAICPWLVTLFNAFYEEATISMVLEFMNGGAPCSSPDAGAAPLPLIRKE